MLECSEQALRIYEDVGNMDQVEKAMGKVSYVFERFGELSKANEFWEKWVKRTIEKYGSVHDRVAMARYYLSVSYLNMKLGAKAAIQLRATLAYYKKKKRYPMGTAQRIAVILRDNCIGLDEARKLFGEVLECETARFGKQDPLTEVDIARCLQLKGLTLTALETYEVAYPILLKTYGENYGAVKAVRSWMNDARTDEEKKESMKT